MENYLIEATKPSCLILNIKVEMKMATLKPSCPQYNQRSIKENVLERKSQSSQTESINGITIASYFEGIIPDTDISCAQMEIAIGDS